MAMTLTEDIHDFFTVQIPQVMAGAIRLYGSFSRAKKPLTERLPNELLSHIFLIACESSSEGEESDPVTLSHVCRRWRRVALSTSKIWTRIVIVYPHTPLQLSRVQAFLTRSRQAPLDIGIDLRDPAWDWEEVDCCDYHITPTDLEVLLHTLLTHVHRWRALEFLSDTWAPIHTFLRHTQNIKAAPMLQTLSLSRCNAYFAMKGETFQPSSLRAPQSLFGRATLPNLTSVSLIGVHVDWSSSSLSGLSELELKYHASDVMPSFAQFKNILARCPDLRRLAIMGWGPILPDPISDDTSMIYHSSLKTLAFGYIDAEYALGLLSLLQFPSVDEISLEDISSTVNAESSSQLDSSPILAFLANGSPVPLRNVRLLSLSGIRSSRDSLRTFYQACDNVVRLSLQYTCDDAVRTLAPTAPSALLSDSDSVGRTAADVEVAIVPLPQVEELHFEDVDVYGITYALQSRADSGLVGKLAKLSLDFVRYDTPSPPCILDQLSQFSDKTLIYSSD